MQHLDRFLGLLDGVERQGRGWQALCPVHPDQNKSLSINLGESNRILFHCHACGRRGGAAILATLGLTWADLFAKGRDRLAEPPTGTCERIRPVAPLEVRHAVYTALCEQTDLADHHREALLARGLTEGDLARAGYFSVERVSRETLEGLWEVPGFVGVPGVVRSRSGQLAMVPSHGIAIPIRNWPGQIAGLQVRTGYPQKYANPKGQPALPHIPLGVQPAARIWLTEGPLKADVSYSLRASGLAVIAVPGVATWMCALSALSSPWPAPNVMQEVVLAFDSDYQDKPAVAAQREQAATQLTRQGYRVLMAEWDRKYKGLDDLLFAGGEPFLRECVNA